MCESSKDLSRHQCREAASSIPFPVLILLPAYSILLLLLLHLLFHLFICYCCRCFCCCCSSPVCCCSSSSSFVRIFLTPVTLLFISRNLLTESRRQEVGEFSDRHVTCQVHRFLSSFSPQCPVRIQPASSSSLLSLGSHHRLHQLW